MAQKLTSEARGAALARLDGWQDKNGKAIVKTFTFADFNEAFGFMVRTAMIVEKMDHHPDWSNSWNKVEVSLSTHAAGGVTESDIKLAEAMDRLATSR